MFADRLEQPADEAFGRSIGKPDLASDVIGGGDVGETACGGKRRIAVAGGNVEDALIAPEVDGFAKLFADDLQGRADNGVIAGLPPLPQSYCDAVIGSLAEMGLPA